jgi:membrane-associated phospholipid phosphatase
VKQAAISKNTALSWPTLSLWMAFFKFAVMIQILWVVVYGGAEWLTTLHNYRVRLHHDAELAIPFHPAAAFIYWSLLPLLWLSPFILHTIEELRRFMTALALAILICGVGFVLLPSSPAYPTVEVTGPFAEVFRLADFANLTHNMCPSLHVALATLAAFSYSQALGLRTATIAIWTWAAGIAISTLICHQHHLIDLVTGVALAGIIGRIVFVGKAIRELDERRIST